jgi:hypothetical protein
MAQCHSTAVWYLSRGPEHRTAISDQALRALATLGKVNADDLLWRPGFESWRSAGLIPGLLTSAPLAGNQSAVKAALSPDSSSDWNLGSLTEMAAALASRLKEIGAGILVSGVDWTKSAQLYARFYGGEGFRYLKQTELTLERFLSRAEHPRILAGILGAWVLVGTLNIVMHDGTADAQLTPRDQPRSEATATSIAPTANRQSRKEAVIERTFSKIDLGLSIVKLQLSDPLTYTSFVEKPASEPHVSKQSETLVPVPLPTKKPEALAKDISMGKSKVTNARTGQRSARVGRREARRPKPMHFGTIGFNFASQ